MKHRLIYLLSLLFVLSCEDTTPIRENPLDEEGGDYIAPMGIYFIQNPLSLLGKGMNSLPSTVINMILLIGQNGVKALLLP